MNPDQKPNSWTWWIAGAILLTLVFWTVAALLGQSIQRKQTQITRNMAIIENKIASLNLKKSDIQANGSSIEAPRVNPAELYGIITEISEETGMSIDNFSWHKPGSGQGNQMSTQSSGKGNDLPVEIDLKGNYRNFTRFLLNLSENTVYQYIKKITLTSIRETDRSIKATLSMRIPN